MGRLTISGAGAVVVDEFTETAGDVVCVDGTVRRVGALGAQESGPPRQAPDDEVLDATGCVVTPGLVNAHHHLVQTAFRTLPATRGVPMATWLAEMGAAYARVGVDPELTHTAALAGLAESLLDGVTTVADHHLTWQPGVDPVALAQATAAAAAALGARLVFVRGTAGDDPDRAAASVEAILATLLPASSAAASGPPAPPGAPSPGAVPYGGVRPDGMLAVAVGPAGVHSDGPETFAALAEVAARYGLPRRTQANEQVDVAVAAERYGRRPLDLLDEWGWLAPDVTLAHLCGITSGEVARLAAAGVTATHAPGADVPMGWGVAPVAALRTAGVTVGLGTSGGGSNDAGHLLADARLAMQVSTLAGPPLPARAVLGMATRGSASGLRRPELGHLRPGAAADLCVWDVGGVDDAGVADPVAGLLWAAPGRRPRHVVVAGQVVVRDGRLVRGDERAIARRLTRELATRPPR